jgi:FAD/FMN-containing dehydrogenase
VDAGLTWKELVTTGVPLGATAPLLTGYINLSIGGTLSVGGVSAVIRQGVQVDKVRELEVVTGRGKRVRCSLRRNRRLFEAVLAGLGQCGIITRVVMDMSPAPQNARTFFLNYLDNAQFFSDFRTLLDRGEFDGVFMLGAPDGAGGFVRQLNAIKYYDGDVPPDGDQLLRGLTLPPSAASLEDQPYLEQVLAVDVVIDFFKAVGLWDGVLHPWFDVWLPDSTVESYVGDVLAGLTPEDVGPTGFLLLFAQKTSELTRPFFRVPRRDDWAFLFDILTAAPAPGPDPAFEAAMLARNRRLFEEARRLGGTRYPIGSLEFSRLDWIRQYGRSWPAFKRAKRRYDPSKILSPGSGIF